MGGSLVSALACVASITRCGPLLCFCLVLFRVFCLGHSLDDTQDVIVHGIRNAGRNPFSFCFGCFFVCVMFLCVCVPFCVVLCLMGLQLDCVLVHYQLF